MIDIKFTRAGNIFDISLDDNGDLESVDSFDSSLQYALLGERRASSSEVLLSQYRRGWIGNEGKDFENGSKLWLFEQSRINRSILNEVKAAAFNGLQFLIDDNLVQNIEVRVTLSKGVVVLTLEILRFNSLVDRRFFELWENTGTT